MFIKNKPHLEKGVTLVELLVVTGVVGILITGFMILINPIQKIGQANDAKRKSDLAQLQRGLEIYYQDNGSYPASSGTYTITGTTWGATWDPYLSRLPKDPTSSKTYIYYTPNVGACANNQCYYIFANLQSGGNDPQACFPGSGNPCSKAANFGLSNSCGGVCNYGISSTNTTP